MSEITTCESDSSCPALCQSRDTDSIIERIKPLITQSLLFSFENVIMVIF
jgi:hypothetical protein